MGGTFKQFQAKSLPLWGFVTGKKTFNQSLRTDGTPIEQAINKRILNIMGQGEHKNSGGYYKPQNYSSLQQMVANDASNQMMSDLMLQKQMADQAKSTQQAQAFQAANAQQQQNISAAMKNSKQNLNNSLMRTPVPSTFSAVKPASNNQFKFPNVSGLTFGK